MTINNWGNNCCDKEEGEEEEGNFGNEEGKKFFKEENEGGMTSTNIEGGHSPGNPPSDYENNNTVITTTTTAKVPESLWRQPPPIPMARRTVMIPQPIEIPAENKYSRGNLYGGGEGCQPISAPPVPNSPFSTILPPPSASRALNAGVVIAHRGVASHEATQRRGELCTPRVIQRNAFRAVDDEADDESESEEDGRVQEIVEENEEVTSVGSNNRKKIGGGINQMIIPPSSGYQSQLNSSRKSAENAAKHLLEELNGNKSEQQTRTELQQQHLPKPRHLIEAQRCQIAELTRQNAALRQELNSVRAISSSQHVVAGREEKIIASTESM
uniref:Uncharacterized protein n=1 Tax=Meloidogyne javanica TaxID=6303 RepID=A0A915MQV4_MELJA